MSATTHVADLPISERSGVRRIPSSDPSLPEIDAAWDSILASPTPPTSLHDLASALFDAMAERESLAAELTAVIERIREVKAKEYAIRGELWKRMDEGHEKRIRCAKGKVVFVADRMREKDGQLEMISPSALRLIPMMEADHGA